MSDWERAVTQWEGVTTHAHRFGGREFRLTLPGGGEREIGHVHPGGVVDIPFTIPVRDAAIDAGKAERHHYLPDSGWTTTRVSRHGLDAAVELLRVSYLRIRRKSADPRVAQAAQAELVALFPAAA